MTTYLTAERISERKSAEGCVQAVYDDLNDIKHSFFRIGFHLHEAIEKRFYATLGYANITDFALDKFGFSQSTTYELIGIYNLARKEDAPLQIAEKYDEYSQSQLRELCRLKMDPNGFMSIVKPTDKVEKVGKAVTFWNKYVTKHSGTPDVNNISELLELDIDTPMREAQAYLKRKAERKEAENFAYAENYAGQLPGQIGLTLDDEPTNEEEFSAYAEKSELQEEPAPAFMTDIELTDYCITYTGGNSFWKERKFRIHNFALNNPTQNEFLNFVKGEYENGYACVHGEPFTKIEFSNNIVITRSTGGKVCLHWASFVGNISRLIVAHHYLTLKEKYEFERWKAYKDGITAASEPSEDSKQRSGEEIFQISGKCEISERTEPKLNRTRTNREFLATLSDEEYINKLLVKILNIYPFRGDSSKFLSMTRGKLSEWLNERQEVQE